ncbi:MAG TPA: tRNA (guanosine(46)-N7)-methyltransferase TrmB [Candidatus Limivivens merdigallinarum]|uniref:tRNA (guanine-N(7)-)-methyltransferase n=1 Tax=Candidatus Limivivens merdigallinarum TaxID=2840859 RepID=A0A9D0ZT44_9FIRM|nr:tRNA (guanosine(46)-N7)-methyltransferase TrmB [Candidatus Limivivens merdigallinarum]
MRLRNIPGAKEAVAESPFVIQTPAEQKGRWAERFGNQNPIHIEVGMGKGQFLTEMALLHPDVNYVGIERYTSVLYRALQKREELEQTLPNLFYLCIDAQELPDIFAPGEVEKIYLNFSDPWPKDRHAKRRLTSREFLARYQQVLPAGGIVEFKTDNRGLFDFSLEEQKEAGWELLACTYNLHKDEKMMVGNVMTEYERKFSKLRNPIHKMVIKCP